MSERVCTYNLFGPINNQSTPSGYRTADYYPLAYDMAGVTELYWRIRNVSISCNVTASAGATSVNFTAGNADDINAFTAEHQLAMTFAQGKLWSKSNAGSPIGGFLSSAAAVTCELFRHGTFWAGYKLDSGLYLPTTSILIQASAQDSTDITDIQQVELQASNIEPVSYDGIFNATIFGVSVPFFYAVTNQLGDGVASISSLTITANEWWPYAARDSSPIWDTSTGAQLQNPKN